MAKYAKMENFNHRIDKVYDKSSKSLRHRDNQINDYSLVERQKGLTMLQKSAIGILNTKNSKKFMNQENNCAITSVYQSDNVATPPPLKPINISDLVKDETINLQLRNSSSPTPKLTAKITNCEKKPNKKLLNNEDKISFEINEITGRSTLYNFELKYAGLSVSDILATSCAPRVRNLRDTLHQSGRNTTITSSISANSTITSFKDMQSLPRTADMSSITTFERNESSDTTTSWSVAGVPSSFSFAKNIHSNSGNSKEFESDESFAPAELMKSRFLNDEIAWAQERAILPINALSKDAKAKYNAQSNEMDTTKNSNHNNSLASIGTMNSVLQDDPNFSLGRYFNLRSENLSNIVNYQSPNKKKRKPIALVDETIKDQSVAVTASLSPSRANIQPSNGGVNVYGNDHNSKDTDNRTTDSSYILSVSAVDRALHNLNMNSDESDRNLFETLFKIKISPRNKNNSTKNHNVTNNHSLETPQKTLTEKATIINFCGFESNKENIDPVLRNNVPMLNSSNINKFHYTLALDAININHEDHNYKNNDIKNKKPKIEIISETGTEADLDEWPSSPIITAQHRRVLRKKSPSPHVSPNDQKKKTTAKTSIGTYVNLVETTKPQEHCSTLLRTENEIELRYEKCTTPTNSDFEYSPNIETTSLQNMHSKNISNSPSRFISGGGSGIGLASGPRSTCSYGSPRSDVMQVLPAPTRSVSSCSSTGEFAYQLGRIVPIKVTTLELSWPSTKLRTTVRKSMQVKNIADKRLFLRIEIIGPGFQILNIPTNNLFTLQSRECRSIKINFCPTVTGVASGILAFYTANSNNIHYHHQQQQQNNVPFLEIPLNAYGGHSRLVPQNICKGPVGPHYIHIGDLCDLMHPLERTFLLYNTGSLCGFFSIDIDIVGSQFRGLSNAFTVTPQRSLIHSGSSLTVRILFKPCREDLKKITKRVTSVLTLAHLRIITGDEANRQRMRRLFRLMSIQERAKLNVKLSEELWSEWPDENKLDNELKNLKETPDTIIDLINYIKVHEIALTITNNDNLDESAAAVETSSLYYPDADETVLFRTVCASQPIDDGTSNINAITSTTHNIDINDTDDGVGDECCGRWYVTPTKLKFDFFAERRKRNQEISLVVHNYYKSRQYFEIQCNQKHLLYCTPSEGYIVPDGGHVNILINSNYQTPPAKLFEQPICLTVYMENERFTVPVEIPDDNYY